MRIHAADGPFDVPLREPATGPGLVLVQEIFGLAALGYVVAVPELFRRTSPAGSASTTPASPRPWTSPPAYGSGVPDRIGELHRVTGVRGGSERCWR